MPSKKISKAVAPANTLSLGKFTGVVAKIPVKDGICPWSMTIVEKKSGEVVAAFEKGFAKQEYIVTIGNQPFPINGNGVRATYADWKVAVEEIIGKEITWQPQGREMFRYSLI